MTLSVPILTLPGTTVETLGDVSVFDHSVAWEAPLGSLAFSVVPESSNGFQGLISKDAKYYGTGGHIGLWIDDGEIYFRLQSDATSYELRGGQIVAGQSHDIGVSFGPDGLSLFVDGESVAEHPYAGGLLGNLEPITLGASQWASASESADALTHLFSGEIGDVRLYDRQLDAAGFSAVFATAGPGEEAEDPGAPVSVQSFEAEDFDATLGVGIFTQGGNRQIGSTQDGEWVRYNAVDFGSDAEAETSLNLRLSSGSNGGTLEVRTGTPDGALLASYATGNTGGWASYDNVTLDLGAVTGVQDLYFVFRGGARSIMDIDRFEISVAEAPADPENRAPVVAPLFDTLERAEDSSTTFNLETVFSDPDGDALIYSVVDGPDYVTIEDTVLRIAPADGDDGVVTVSVEASDGALTSEAWTFELTVLDSVVQDPVEIIQEFEAEDFDATLGVGVFTQGGNRQIGSTQDGEWVRYDAIDFGFDPDAAQTLELRLASGSSGGTVEVRTGAPDGPLLASHTTGNTGGWASYEDITLDLGSVTGLQDLHFVFRGGARSIMDIDRFRLITTPDGVAPANQAPEPWRPFFDETTLD
ncbi:MAG: carbohydrate-binding protein, partial [Pseudomonadota bacterium]